MTRCFSLNLFFNGFMLGILFFGLTSFFRKSLCCCNICQEYASELTFLYQQCNSGPLLVKRKKTLRPFFFSSEQLATSLLPSVPHSENPPSLITNIPLLKHSDNVNMHYFLYHYAYCLSAPL